MNIDCLFLECFLCKKPPYKARQCTSCQIILCYKCLLPTIGISNICPACQMKLVCQPLNKIGQILLEQVKVYCKYCKTKMSSFTIRKHAKQCKIKNKIKNSIKIYVYLQFSHNNISKCQVCLNYNVSLQQCKYCQKLKCFSCLSQNPQKNNCFQLPFQTNSQDFIKQMQEQMILCNLCKLQINSFEQTNHFQDCQYMETFCANDKCLEIIQRNQFSSHIVTCTNKNIKNLKHQLDMMKKAYSHHFLILQQVNVEENQYTSLFNNILGFQTRNQIQETPLVINFE